MHFLNQVMLDLGQVLDAACLLAQFMKQGILPARDAMHPPETNPPADRTQNREKKSELVVTHGSNVTRESERHKRDSFGGPVNSFVAEQDGVLVGGMRLSYQHFSKAGLTVIEVLVIILIVIGLVILLMPPLANNDRRNKRWGCLSNLKQTAFSAIALSDEYPRQFPWQRTNGSFSQPNAVVHFRVLSNELITPAVLMCPTEQQQGKRLANDFSKLKPANISYFLVMDSEAGNPSGVLLGDRDVTGLSSGTPCKASGISAPTFKKEEARWTGRIHKYGGNLAFADGHVGQNQGTNRSELISQSPSACGVSHVLVP